MQAGLKRSGFFCCRNVIKTIIRKVKHISKANYYYILFVSTLCENEIDISMLKGKS